MPFSEFCTHSFSMAFLQAYRQYEKGWEEVARTEASAPGVVDPNFSGSMRLKYISNKRQTIRVEIFLSSTGLYSGALDQYESYGESVCELKDVMDAPGLILFDAIMKGDRPVKGTVMVGLIVFVLVPV